MTQPDAEAPTAATTRAIKIFQFIDPPRLATDMSYSLTDLSQAMMEQASLLVHYGVKAAKAARQVDSTKMKLEIAEARVYRRLRDEAAKTGTKPTEMQLEKAVAIHPTVINIKRGLAEAKMIESMAKAAVEGFRHRRDMLVQAGATEREERKGELSMSARNEAQSAVEDLKERVLKRTSLVRDEET